MVALRRIAPRRAAARAVRHGVVMPTGPRGEARCRGVGRGLHVEDGMEACSRAVTGVVVVGERWARRGRRLGRAFAGGGAEDRHRHEKNQPVDEVHVLPSVPITCNALRTG